jgi:hypothetical protein
MFVASVFETDLMADHASKKVEERVCKGRRERGKVKKTQWYLYAATQSVTL